MVYARHIDMQLLILELLTASMLQHSLWQQTVLQGNTKSLTALLTVTIVN